MRLTDEQIAAELRALRETPSEEFAAELDTWAARGFPRADRAGAPAPSRRLAALRDRLTPLRGRLLPLGAAGATAVVVIGVAVAQLGEPDQPSTGDGVSLESVEPAERGGESRQAQPGTGGGAEPAPGDAVLPEATTVPPVPPGDQELKPGRERVQERSASMTLSTEADQVDEVADGVIEVTERYRGIVVSSNVSSSEGTGRASFDLRIPSAKLQAALADLSDLASVTSRNEGTLDITSPFVTAEERFEDARAEVSALLDRLAEVDSATEIASIREQLRLARAELAASRAELGALKQRADFSRLSVSVVGDGDADGWSIGDAADDAVSVLESLAGAGLVALSVIVPLGGLAIAAWIGLGALRRRRRESALDE